MSLDCSSLSLVGDELALCEYVASAATTLDDNLAASQGDTTNFFLIWGSSLVLFMHAGFAMLSAGAIRSKNSKNILMSIVMDLTVAAVGWFVLGYGLAFGEDVGLFIGTSLFAGFGVVEADFAFFLFQYCFAATAATIVSGAIAERARFETYLLTSAYMTCWVYPVVVHWVWGGGFLTLGTGGLLQTGALDFAGCGPVHMVGGVAGMVGSWIMGPRLGRFDAATGQAVPMPGHSASLATMGVFILWVGWFGFNCGSVLDLAGGGVTASRAGLMTVLSSSTGALTAMFIVWGLTKEFDLTTCLNGALGGLVSITGCCAFVEMWAAMLIGVIGGAVYVGSSKLLLNVMKIDDPLDATPVHFFCGMWGLIAGGCFVNPVLVEGIFTAGPGDDPVEVPAGIFYNGGVSYKTTFGNGTSVMGGSGRAALLATAIVEICVVFAWVVLFTFPWFFVLHKLGVLRIAAADEEVGLDITSHGGSAYPDAAPATKKVVDDGNPVFTEESKKVDIEEAPRPVSIKNIDDVSVAAYQAESADDKPAE